jgi:hypothetical protein
VLILRRAWSSRGRPNGDNLPILCDGSQRVTRAIRADRHVAAGSEPPNKGMKLTRPSVLEPCSLSPVFDGRAGVRGTKLTETSCMATDELKPPADLQTPLHDQIAKELIALTPEHWRSVRLRLVRKTVPPEAGVIGQGIAHSISSPEGHREVVMPGDDLFARTHALDTLFRQYGAEWLVAEYVVSANPAGVWSWDVSFTYPKHRSGEAARGE